MKHIEAACLIILTAAFVYLLSEGGFLLRDARRDLAIHSKELSQTLTDADRTVIIVGGVARNIEGVSRSWKAQQDQLTIQSATAIKSWSLDLENLATWLSAVNSLTNSQSRSLSALEATVSSSVSDMGQSFVNLTVEAQPILNNAATATAEASNGLSSAMPSFVEASQHLDKMAGNGDAITGDAKELSDHYTQKLLHPVRTKWDKVTLGVKLGIEAVKSYLLWP